MVNIVVIDIVVVVLIQGHLTVFTDKLVLLRVVLKAIFIVHIFLLTTVKNTIYDTLRISIFNCLPQIFVLRPFSTDLLVDFGSHWSLSS